MWQLQLCSCRCYAEEWMRSQSKFKLEVFNIGWWLSSMTASIRLQDSSPQGCLVRRHRRRRCKWLSSCCRMPSARIAFQLLQHLWNLVYFWLVNDGYRKNWRIERFRIARGSSLSCASPRPTFQDDSDVDGFSGDVVSPGFRCRSREARLLLSSVHSSSSYDFAFWEVYPLDIWYI